MLTCRDVSERATDYLERALPLRDNLAMRLHLGLCGACRAYLGQMRMTARLLRHRPLGAPPPEINEKLADQLRTPPGSPHAESPDSNQAARPDRPD